MDEDLINEIGTEGVAKRLHALDPKDQYVQETVKRILGYRNAKLPEHIEEKRQEG